MSKDRYCKCLEKLLVSPAGDLESTETMVSVRDTRLSQTDRFEWAMATRGNCIELKPRAMESFPYWSLMHVPDWGRTGRNIEGVRAGREPQASSQQSQEYQRKCCEGCGHRAFLEIFFSLNKRDKIPRNLKTHVSTWMWPIPSSNLFWEFQRTINFSLQ